jgi:hypothetical protein
MTISQEVIDDLDSKMADPMPQCDMCHEAAAERVCKFCGKHLCLECWGIIVQAYYTHKGHERCPAALEKDLDGDCEFTNVNTHGYDSRMYDAMSARDVVERIRHGG